MPSLEDTLMHQNITYAELASQLTDLGYALHSSNTNGRPQNVFTHRRYKSATIVLPRIDPEESVLPIHLAAVNSILEAHGLTNTVSGR